MRGTQFAIIFDFEGLIDTRSNKKAKKATSILWWATYMLKKQKGDEKPEMNAYLNRKQFTWQNGRAVCYQAQAGRGKGVYSNQQTSVTPLKLDVGPVRKQKRV